MALEIQDAFDPYYEGREGDSKAGREVAEGERISSRPAARSRRSDSAAWERVQMPGNR